MDGLCDPAVKGELVVPVVSEFVQVINTGSQWVCLSTISSIRGTVKIYDSLFIRPSPIAIDHSCRLLMHTGNQVTFLNEKVQKQTNTNDCGLFALAFATDLCHGIDPVSQCYDPQHMREHYVHCLDSQKGTFPYKQQKDNSGHLLCLQDAQRQAGVCPVLSV